MNDHANHNAGHHDHHNHPAKAPWHKTLHRSWIFWTAVVLMIVAMVVYVMSLDEAIRPVGPDQAPVPAAQ